MAWNITFLFSISGKLWESGYTELCSWLCCQPANTKQVSNGVFSASQSGLKIYCIYRLNLSFSFWLNLVIVCLTRFWPMFHLWLNQVIGFYKQNVSKNQLPGLTIRGTLVENGWRKRFKGGLGCFSFKSKLISRAYERTGIHL